MPLITCPDCAKQVSDAAPACPGCGRPIAKTVQTVEQTGKTEKGLMLVGLMIFAAGSAMACGGTREGVPILVLGGSTVFYGMMSAWWNHR